MNNARMVINLEETIGKQVGRRKPPVDPLHVAGDLNKLATDLLAASGHSRLTKRSKHSVPARCPNTMWSAWRMKSSWT